MEISNDVYGSAWAGVRDKAPSFDALYERLNQVAGSPGLPIFGTYQPVASTVSSNLTNLILDIAQYMRVNDVVIVSGTFNTKITTANVQSDFYMSMPFTSNFTLTGHGAGAGSFGFCGTQIYIDAFVSTKLMRFGSKPAASNASNTTASYMYGYLIV